MSKQICASAIDGAIQWVTLAETRLNEAIQSKGGGMRSRSPGPLTIYR